MENKFVNILEELNIDAYTYLEETNTFEPNYSNAIIISELILLTEKLTNLSINYVVGDHYDVKVIFN